MTETNGENQPEEVEVKKLNVEDKEVQGVEDVEITSSDTQEPKGGCCGGCS